MEVKSIQKSPRGLWTTPNRGSGFLKVGHSNHVTDMVLNPCNNISNFNSLIKRIILVSITLVISFVLFIAQNDSISVFAGKYFQREVWHHSETLGILVFQGGQRTLLECELILMEGR